MIFFFFFQLGNDKLNLKRGLLFFLLLLSMSFSGTFFPLTWSQLHTYLLK